MLAELKLHPETGTMSIHLRAMSKIEAKNLALMSRDETFRVVATRSAEQGKTDQVFLATVDKNLEESIAY